MCNCGARAGTGPTWGCGIDKCCGNPGGRTIFDMMTDPCAKRNWNNCKAEIYGKAGDGPTCSWCSPISPSCRFPPRRCPPPPPPPRNCCTCHRCNPNRAIGFIVKPSHYPCGRPACCPCEDGCPCEESCRPGCGGSCSMHGCCGSGGGCPQRILPPSCNPCNPRCPPNDCGIPPACCPVPDPYMPCIASTSTHCRPAWKHTALRAAPYCLNPPPLPPRSYRYKCWISQFQPRTDSNLCPSRYSSMVDNCDCNMVIAEPPDCDPCDPCPCHPCTASCCF